MPALAEVICFSGGQLSYVASFFRSIVRRWSRNDDVVWARRASVARPTQRTCHLIGVMHYGGNLICPDRLESKSSAAAATGLICRASRPSAARTAWQGNNAIANLVSTQGS